MNLRLSGTKATIALLTLCVTASARQAQTSSSGYELYSWKVKSTWHYSLIRGSGRELRKEEILTNRMVKIGDSALRAELKRLPRGEKVYWMSDAPQGVITPSGEHTTGFKQPSRKRIERLKSYCNKIGIDLILR